MKHDADYWKGFWAGRAIAVRLAGLKAKMPPINPESTLSIKITQMMSYNGFVTSEIPKWDKETYPYAILCRDTRDSSCSLYAQSKPFIVEASDAINAGPGDLVANFRGTALSAHTIMSGDFAFWSNVSTIGASGVLVNTESSTLTWANHDIYHTNGNLYFTASEPVCPPERATTAWVSITQTGLLYTDKVYRIQAWVYKKGLTYHSPTAVFTSELFGALPFLKSRTERHLFTGLTPNTEYEVYAVITGGEFGDDQNAIAEFMTSGG